MAFWELQHQLHEAETELRSVEKHINEMMGGCIGWYEDLGRAKKDYLEGERLYCKLVEKVENLREELSKL